LGTVVCSNDLERHQLLTPEGAASLSITRMIFHLVGKPDGPTLLDAEVQPGAQKAFLLDRVESVLRGSRYDFEDDSLVEQALVRAGSGSDPFLAESRMMAAALHDAQRKRSRSKPGVLVLFELGSPFGTLWALLKFDEGPSLTYKVNTRDGKVYGEFIDSPNSINESKESLQMAAIVRLPTEENRPLQRSD
jgi:hypothetical protein